MSDMTLTDKTAAHIANPILWRPLQVHDGRQPGGEGVFSHD
jgi:hypothetical protein